MTLRQKLTLAGGVAFLVAAMFLAASWSPSSGYFYSGLCACGNECYVRIQGDGYFSYSPGHGVPEYRKFTLRRNGEGWDIMGLPHSDLYWSPLEGENKVIGRLYFHDGALYESWGSNPDWTRLPRASNVWRIWAAKLLKK